MLTLTLFLLLLFGLFAVLIPVVSRTADRLGLNDRYQQKQQDIQAMNRLVNNQMDYMNLGDLLYDAIKVSAHNTRLIVPPRVEQLYKKPYLVQKGADCFWVFQASVSRFCDVSDQFIKQELQTALSQLTDYYGLPCIQVRVKHSQGCARVIVLRTVSSVSTQGQLQI